MIDDMNQPESLGERRRRLIVNADDFGLSEGVNQGILQAHRRGIVTSASLMVRQPAAASAVELARAYPRLSLGLHLDLGEWAFRNDRWVPLYEVVTLTDKKAVREEVFRQFDRFEELTGALPTHIDSHQHVHTQEELREAIAELAAGLPIPVRTQTPGLRYCGDFYGQTGCGQPLPSRISVAALLALIAELPPGVTELACHPGLDDRLDTMYCRERSEEVATLCNRRVRDELVLQSVQLISFADVSLPIQSTPRPQPPLKSGAP